MSELPAKVSDVDLLRYRLAEERAKSAALTAQLARAELSAISGELQQRYALTPADQVRDDGTIVRAPQPEPAP